MRYILLIAILLYDILLMVSCKHAIMGHRRNLDDGSSEAAKRHHYHKAWRKKALIQTELEDEPQYRDNKDDFIKEDTLEDKPLDKFESILDIGGNDNKRTINDHYIDEFEDFHDQNQENVSDERTSDLEEEHEKPPVDPSSQRFKEKYEDKKFIHKIDCDRTNERFESCFAGCAAVTCDNPRDRLRPCYPFCEPGCVCVRPFVRDDRTHKCVLPEDCSKGLKGIPDIGNE